LLKAAFFDEPKTSLLGIRPSDFSVRVVTIGPSVINILKEHMEAERSQRGSCLRTVWGCRWTWMRWQRDVIRPAFQAAGLEWKGYYGGRRGAETEMNRHAKGNSQITSHHFGHSKDVADAHYIKPIPEEKLRLLPSILLYRETRTQGRN
jgi:hypothetical protein